MTQSEFQSRVEWVIGELERMHDRQYPLRSIPMDMVADAVATECGGGDVSLLPPSRIASALNAILQRNRGAVVLFNVTAETFDATSPWSGSSYLPHEGIDRLSDGSAVGPSE